MCLTAKGEFMSTGKVRRLTMTSLWTQLVSAVVLEVTKCQSSPRHTPTSSQSHQETWLGSSSTGPGKSSGGAL